MKIYTRSGDQGQTGLFSGERVAKNDARIEAYGDLDELNAFLGALAESLGAGERAQAGPPLGLLEEILGIQTVLLRAGAWLATTPESAAAEALPLLTGEEAAGLEAAIDRMVAQLSELRTFILPGGNRAACWAHLGRTVCRRAERRVVAVSDTRWEGAPEAATGARRGAEQCARILVYLNRLSDYLFVLARFINHRAGVKEQIWEP